MPSIGLDRTRWDIIGVPIKSYQAPQVRILSYTSLTPLTPLMPLMPLTPLTPLIPQPSLSPLQTERLSHRNEKIPRPRVERPPQSRGDRSGEIGAEASNIVASIGRIDEKEIHLLFDYSHKAYDCKAIRLHYNRHHADKSSETPPVERPSHRNEKRANNRSF